MSQNVTICDKNVTICDNFQQMSHFFTCLSMKKNIHCHKLSQCHIFFVKKTRKKERGERQIAFFKKKIIT